MLMNVFVKIVLDCTTTPIEAQNKVQPHLKVFYHFEVARHIPNICEYTQDASIQDCLGENIESPSTLVTKKMLLHEEIILQSH